VRFALLTQKQASKMTVHILKKMDAALTKRVCCILE